MLAILALLSVPLILLAGSEQWFNIDEWALLTDDAIPSGSALLADHNGHWVTLPRLSYFGLYSVFGLRTYLPYQLLVVLTHIAAVGMSYLVSRRMGVVGWLAAAVAACLLLFGSGAMNMVFAFQMSLNASLVLGLAQLLLADHDGQIERRDRWGLVAGLLGLMTSALMVPMLVGVGVATFLRRGWRAATFHAGIPLGVFVIWYFVAAGGDSERTTGTLTETVLWFLRMAASPFEAMGGNLVAAVVLGTTAILAIVWLVRDYLSTRDLSPLAVPAGALTAWLLFCATTSVSRSILYGFDPTLASSSRYVHVSAILLSPFVALGIGRLWDVRRFLGWISLGALVLGVPGNMQALADWDSLVQGENEEAIVGIAHSRFIDAVPQELVLSDQPFATYDEWGFDAGWLSAAAEAGDLPDPSGLSASERLTGDLRVVTAVPPVPLDDPPCDPAPGPIDVTVDAGQMLVFGGEGVTLVATDGETNSEPRFVSKAGETSGLEVLAGPIDLRVRGRSGVEPMICVS